MLKKRRLTSRSCASLCGILPLTALCSVDVQAKEITFDTEMIQSRGLNVNLNRYFARAPRFLPGTHSVQVKINGKDKGTVAARFGEDGTLCVDRDFIEFSGLMPVPLKKNEECHDIVNDYAQAVVKALPGQEMVELYLPPEALNGMNGDIKNFQHGGIAGLLNYDLFSTRSEYGGSDTNLYSQASLEGGINISDWSLRSRYILTDDNGDKNVESVYTFAEHVFDALKMTAQVGEINASSYVLSGAPIAGVQLMPTRALQGSGSGVSVSGMARNAQARVEVRQSGRLIYSTLVPAGPFTLDDVPIVSSNVELEVTVIESDGSSNRFIVPAASVMARKLSRPQGLAASFGQIRDIKGDYENPWVLNLSDGWRILPRLNLLASGAAAKNYLGGGVHTEYLLTDNWSASTSVAVSQEKFGEKNSGVKTELQSSLKLAESLSASASATHFTPGYRELTDALNDDFQPYSNTYSTSLAWFTPPGGTFSAGFNYNQSRGEGNDSRYLLLSWGRNFDRATVSVNWQRAMGNKDGRQDDDLLYVNLSIPFGGSQRVSSYMRKQGNRNSYGVQNSGALSQDSYYYISVDRDRGESENSVNGNLSTNLHYSRLGIGGGRSGSRHRNYNATLSGGVAAHKSGVTFTPYTIRNTFAIAKLSESKAGVEISTPQGTVWTDYWGQAVIPGLNEWRNSRIEIDANKLPASMTLANGTKYVAAAHASVSEVGFKVLNNRRVMIRVKRADNRALDKGLSIVDEKGNYIVTSVDDGHVFLNEAEQVSALYAMDDDNNRLCKIDYILSKKKDEDAFYEEVDGVCR